jgi:hypothetical protein
MAAINHIVDPKTKDWERPKSLCGIFELDPQSFEAGVTVSTFNERGELVCLVCRDLNGEHVF